jgi:hypothetical protein
MFLIPAIMPCFAKSPCKKIILILVPAISQNFKNSPWPGFLDDMSLFKYVFGPCNYDLF